MAHLDSKLKTLIKEMQVAVVSYLDSQYNKDDSNCFYCEVEKIDYSVWEGDLSDVNLGITIRYGYYAGEDCSQNFSHTAIIDHLDTDWTAEFIRGFVIACLYREEGF